MLLGPLCGPPCFFSRGATTWSPVAEAGVPPGPCSSGTAALVLHRLGHKDVAAPLAADLLSLQPRRASQLGLALGTRDQNCRGHLPCAVSLVALIYTRIEPEQRVRQEAACRFRSGSLKP